MSIRVILSLMVVWVLSLFVVASVVKAQVYAVRPLPEPITVSGPDFGFRIEGDQNGTAIGRLVVRINGKLIDANIGSVGAVPRISSR